MIVKVHREGNDRIGLQVGLANAKRFFRKDIQFINLRLDDLEILCILSPDFWDKRPEIHDVRLSRWLESRVWPRDHDQERMLTMVPSGVDTFVITSKPKHRSEAFGAAISPRRRKAATESSLTLSSLPHPAPSQPESRAEGHSHREFEEGAMVHEIHPCESHNSVHPLVFPTDPDFYKHLLDNLLDHMSEGVRFVDADRRILYSNGGVCRLTGHDSQEVVGRLCQDDTLCCIDYEGRRVCHDGCPLSGCVNDGATRKASFFLRHKQGRRVPVSVRVEPMRDAAGSIVGAIEIFSDDSPQIEAHRNTASMEQLSFLDQLTQLPNRSFVELTLDTALAEYRVRQEPFGVLAFNLDNLQTINDSHGHECGDRALQEVARTVSGSLRPTDVVGRWRGDEFRAIVRNMNQEMLTTLANRCVLTAAKISLPLDDGAIMHLSISVGATLALPGDIAAGLLGRIDALMDRSRVGQGLGNDGLGLSDSSGADCESTLVDASLRANHGPNGAND